jgi:hypothetical protein
MEALLLDLESHIKRCDGGLPAYIQKHGLTPDLAKFQPCGDNSFAKFRIWADAGKARLSVLLHHKSPNIVIFTHPWPSSDVPIVSMEGWEIVVHIGDPTTLGCAISHLDWWVMNRPS